MKSEPESIDAEALWWAESGDVAYCLSEGRPSPTTITHHAPGIGDPAVGPTTVKATGTYVDSDVAWILENSFPSKSVFNGVRLTEREARQATQVAIWLANDGDSGKRPGGWNADEIYPNLSREGAQKTYDAMLWLYNTSQLESSKPHHNYKRYSLDGTLGTQSQWMTLAVPVITQGQIEITKGSTNPDITDHNGNYQLEGAVFEVRNAAGELADTLITDNTGFARTQSLPYGTYTITEISAPPGYALDAWEKTVELDDELVQVAMEDAPLMSPISLLVQKYDTELVMNEGAQGAGALAGAQFTLNYHTGAGSDPLRTWVFQTDTNGQVLITDGTDTFIDAAGMEQPYLVSGDPLYLNSAGEPAFPLGVVTVQETKAPSGYLLPEEPIVHTIHITADGQGGQVSSYMAPAIADDVIRGDLALMKYGEPSLNPDEDPEVKTPLEGVEFQIINANEQAVITPDGTKVEPGEIVLSITTDEQGYATTEGLHARGALPYGTYRIHEIDSTTPPDFSPVEDFTFSVGQEAHTTRFILEDKSGTAIRILKTDAQTGQQVSGQMTFKLQDSDGKDVVFRMDHPTPAQITVLTTDETGSCVLPQKLAAGTYRIVELSAPEGYALPADPIEFTVSSETVNTFQDPLVIEVADEPQRGRIELLKVDVQTGEKIHSNPATFQIRAASDIITADGTLRASAGEIVDVITTDDDGSAVSAELYLGSYDVIETTPPTGYVKPLSPIRVEVTAQSATSVVSSVSLVIENEPNSFTVEKTDLKTATPLAGATFEMTHEESGDVIRITTETSGLASTERISAGTYVVREVEAPAGYLLPEDGGDFRVIVDENGYISGQIHATEGFVNDHTRVLISKRDITTGEEVLGAELRILDPEGNTVESWISDSEPYLIEHLDPGHYTLEETLAPKGYLIANTISFTVETTGKIQRVTMLDDFTKVEFWKLDAQDLTPLAGAELELQDSGGTVVAEWTSSKGAHRIERLLPGDYRLREVTAPDGYERAEDLSFTVLASADVQSIEMLDEREPERILPRTGDESPRLLTAVLVLAGVITVIVGSGLIKRRRYLEP